MVQAVSLVPEKVPESRPRLKSVRWVNTADIFCVFSFILKRHSPIISRHWSGSLWCMFRG